MSQGCFYLLPEASSPEALILSVCQLTTDYYRQGLGVFIYAQDQAQAEMLDEAFWQQPADGFIAHNLQGEGPLQGAQVIIGWQTPQSGRAVLINLAPLAPDFARRFKQLVDFVPADDAGKQAARERFKAYRQAGFTLTTAPVPSQTQDE
ncbi:DNA polymerase III subunit chi [Oceanisphaera pacifica]|uniref:DNA polymerase III subunit chi n=1 Tax=Oceanisphaera pacifica TaxID=2818389 RepID=A0ABS3NFL3_9GAMM|nr:DNA polymerase III subunit chi [Oceanisphaera pacifica]MBO1519312.1 DNA polymerase III subunit chi [Oceanisphaera pacifica]